MDGIETQAFFSVRESTKPLKNEGTSTSDADFLSLVMSDTSDDSSDTTSYSADSVKDSKTSVANSGDLFNRNSPLAFSDSHATSLATKAPVVHASHQEVVTAYSAATTSQVKDAGQNQSINQKAVEALRSKAPDKVNAGDQVTARKMTSPVRGNASTHTYESQRVTQAHLPVKSATGVVDTRKVGVDLTAFATYKLSYIDRVYAYGIANETSAPVLLKGAAEASLKAGPDISVEQTLSHLEALSVQATAHSFTSDSVATEIKQERLASMTFNARDFYAKSKVTLLGDDDKTLLVRDYTTEAISDYKALKNNPAILDGTVNKIIVNGKEI